MFEAIWETKELLVSFDGMNVYRPITGDGAHRTRSGWWHVDQGRLKKGRQAIQGFVSLTDATPSTGGLCVMPGSHTSFEDLLTYAATNDSDHVRVPSSEINPLCHNPRLVTCLAGDIVVWDSRTVHCNTPPLVDALEPQYALRDSPCLDKLLRVAVYLCMTPARAVSAEARVLPPTRLRDAHWHHPLARPLLVHIS